MVKDIKIKINVYTSGNVYIGVSLGLSPWLTSPSAFPQVYSIILRIYCMCHVNHWCVHSAYV